MSETKKIIRDHYRNKDQEYLQRSGQEIIQNPMIITQEVGSELLVFDVRREETHLLPEKSAELFELADSCESLDHVLESLPNEIQEQEACEVLSELADRSLVILKNDTFTRRKFLKVAAAAAPIIATVASAAPAAAQSFPLPLPDGGISICSCGVECVEFGGSSICNRLAGASNYEICFDNSVGCEPITNCVALGADFLACVEACGAGLDMAFCKFCSPPGQCGNGSVPARFSTGCGCLS